MELRKGAMPDLLVSANDAKYARVAGRDTYPRNASPDTLTVVGAASDPPRIVATFEVATTITGPPQAVALSPDARRPTPDARRPTPDCPWCPRPFAMTMPARP